jgi:hypothetical protein
VAKFSRDRWSKNLRLLPVRQEATAETAAATVTEETTPVVTAAMQQMHLSSVPLLRHLLQKEVTSNYVDA